MRSPETSKPCGGFESLSDITSLVSISILLCFFAPVSSFSHLLCFCLSHLTSLLLICSVALAHTSLFLWHQLFFFHRLLPFSFQISVFSAVKVSLFSSLFTSSFCRFPLLPVAEMFLFCSLLVLTLKNFV